MSYLTILSGIIVLLLGLVIGKILGRLIIKILHEIDTNRFLGKLRINYNVEAIVGNLASIIVYIYSFYLALRPFGVANFFLYAIGFVVLLIVGSSFLISVKEFIPNVLAGFIVKRKMKYKAGSKIEFENMSGIVEKVTSHDVRIKTKEGDLILIPYSTILKKSNN